MLKELAKLQTFNRNCLKQIKKQDSQLRDRDEMITKLGNEIVNLRQKALLKRKDEAGQPWSTSQKG